MEFFRMWVLGIIVRVCEGRKSDSLFKAANYIVTFMGILKKMMKDKNIEGASYLIPVLMNIKHIMPKLWAHAVSRRPEIEPRLNEYG